MLRAVIFDFNGILVDDEPIHFDLFQKVLEEEGIALSEENYYARYLGMDDKSCFRAAFREHGRPLGGEALGRLIQRKARYYRDAVKTKVRVFPGAGELVAASASRYPLAIGSGALRSEIEAITEIIGLRKYFQVIVSSEDISEGKPNPEVFLLALSRLNGGQRGKRIAAAECLVIEDSREGLLGAHRAGMRCLAVTNSRAAGELVEADAVVGSLAEIDLAFLEKLVV